MRRIKRPKAVGWYRYQDHPPTVERGCTVEPIKSVKYLQQITRLLQPKPRDHALWLLGINAGFRAGDLLRLRWRDVLTDGGDISHGLRLKERKTGNVRRLPLGDGVRKALRRLLDSLGGAGAVNPDDCVFRSRRNGPISVQRLHQMVNEWATAVGLEGNYGSHTLRKTFGYWLHEKGAPVLEVMAIFGHSSPAVTTRYIGIDQARFDRRIMALDLG